MRLWSIHLSYLDSKGLVALWREGLLALHVLQGKTKGYTKHPQLIRFKAQEDPIGAISAYLHSVVDEADARQYKFDRSKLPLFNNFPQIAVTKGQIMYEIEHLKSKLKARDMQKYLHLTSLQVFKSHPLFRVVPGEKEDWEKG